MSDALETFARSSTAYAATVAIGLVCSYLGLFTILRRIVFTGVALAQLAAAGVAAAFFVADAAWLPGWITGPASRHGATAGSVGLALAGALGLQAGQKRVTPDALVGFVFAAASAVAVLLVWRSPQGLAQLHGLLAGEVLLSRAGGLTSLWIGLAAVTAVHVWFRRELLLASFDPEFARALRLPEQRLQLLLLGSLAVAVAVSLQAGGLLLVLAFLVLPPMTGLLVGDGLPQSTGLALATAAGSSLLGFLGAILLELPLAPSVATTQVLLFGAAWGCRHRPRAVRVARVALAGLGVLGATAVPLAWLGAPVGRTAIEVPASPVAPPTDGH